MSAREDALVAAADLILEIEKIALQQSPDGRTTVGTTDIFPNSRNVIPGRVRLGVDMRHPDEHILSTMATELRATFHDMSKRRGTTGSVSEIWYSPPTLFDTQAIDTVEEMAQLRCAQQQGA